MASKFMGGDVVQVKPEVRKVVCDSWARTWRRHGWFGTVRGYICGGGKHPYGVQPGTRANWVWFAASELELISRPKPKTKGGK